MPDLTAWKARSRDASLGYATGLLGVSSCAMAVLHALGRATPSRMPRRVFGWFDLLAWVNPTVWVALFAVVAVLIAAGVRLRSVTVLMLACGTAAGVWFVWAVLLVLWSLTTVPPVSMTAPAVIMLIAVPLAFHSAWEWSRRD